MRKTVAVLAAGVLGASAAPAAAQTAPDTTALRNAVTRAEILRYEQRLNAIGLANENTRLTASTGNWETVNFVVDELRRIGYNPTVLPYVNASSPNTWAERTPPVLERTLADGSTKTYVNALNNTGDYSQMTWGHTGDLTAKVIPVARITVPPVGTADGTRAGCAMADFPATVKDNIALVQRGGCTFLEKAINARANGAKAVFIMNEGQTNRTQPGTTTNGTTFTRVVGQTYPGPDGRDAVLRRGQGVLRRRAGRHAADGPLQDRQQHRPADRLRHPRRDPQRRSEPRPAGRRAPRQRRRRPGHQRRRLGHRDEPDDRPPDPQARHPAEVQDPLRLVLRRGAGPVRLAVRRQRAQHAADRATRWRCSTTT